MRKKSSTPAQHAPSAIQRPLRRPNHRPPRCFAISPAATAAPTISDRFAPAENDTIIPAGSSTSAPISHAFVIHSRAVPSITSAGTIASASRSPMWLVFPSPADSHPRQSGRFGRTHARCGHHARIASSASTHAAVSAATPISARASQSSVRREWSSCSPSQSASVSHVTRAARSTASAGLDAHPTLAQCHAANNTAAIHDASKGNIAARPASARASTLATPSAVQIAIHAHFGAMKESSHARRSITSGVSASAASAVSPTRCIASSHRPVPVRFPATATIRSISCS